MGCLVFANAGIGRERGSGRSGSVSLWSHNKGIANKNGPRLECRGPHTHGTVHLLQKRGIQTPLLVVYALSTVRFYADKNS